MSWDGHETLWHGESIEDWVASIIRDAERLLWAGHRVPLDADDADHLTVLAKATTPTAVYLAVRNPEFAFALICPYERHHRNEHQFWIKFLSENDGPKRYFDCPATILDKLDPPRTPEALAWREGCRQHAAPEHHTPAPPLGVPGLRAITTPQR